MKYSKEFKEEAIKLSDEIGLKKAAQQLGIQYYTLSDWRSKRNAAIKAQKNERLITPSGLSLVGQVLGKSDLIKKANRMRTEKRSQPQIKNGL